MLPTALASQILIVTITRYSLLVSAQSTFQILNIFRPLWPNKNFLSVKHLSLVCWDFHKKKKKTYIALLSSLLRRHVIVVNYLLYGFFILKLTNLGMKSRFLLKYQIISSLCYDFRGGNTLKSHFFHYTFRHLNQLKRDRSSKATQITMYIFASRRHVSYLFSESVSVYVIFIIFIITYITIYNTL